jgi:hypothetical protein
VQIRFENGRAIIASRSAVPGEIDADPRDRRRLGVKIAGLRVDGHEIPLDHPALTVGWHDREPDGRWTNGAAEIPQNLCGEAQTLAVTLAATLRYPLDMADAFQPTRQTPGTAYGTIGNPPLHALGFWPRRRWLRS